jgi:type I restriction enzyme S subunit
MKTWPTAKLGELVAFKTGKLDSNAAVPDGDYPFFTCSQETLRTNTFSFDTECVLLAGNNANGIYPLKYFHGKFDAYQRTYVVKPRDTGVLTTKFLFYALRPKLSELRSVSTGAATKFLTLTILNETEIQIPPLPVQRQIAGILSAYDELMENSQRRIRLLEAMARPLYREWFVHFRFPGHEKLPRVASPLGEIPQGWEVKKLGEIAEDMRRNVPKGKLDEPKPYVGLEHIPRRSLALDAWETATELGSNKLAFKKGEVLFGKIRPYFHKVSVAPFDGLCSADTIVIRSRRPEHYACVVACVSSDAFVAEASATANGAKMPRANWDVLEKYQVVIPKGKVAERFSALFADVIAQQQALIFQIQNLRRTRDMLLPRLLSGQVHLSRARI